MRVGFLLRCASTARIVSFPTAACRTLRAARPLTMCPCLLPLPPYYTCSAAGAVSGDSIRLGGAGAAAGGPQATDAHATLQVSVVGGWAEGGAAGGRGATSLLLLMVGHKPQLPVRPFRCGCWCGWAGVECSDGVGVSSWRAGWHCPPSAHRRSPCPAGSSSCGSGSSNGAGSFSS